MSKVDNRRKIAFSLRPDNNPADDFLLTRFEGLSTSARARKYRAYMLMGAFLDHLATSASAESILSETVNAGLTLDEGRSLLRIAIPELFDTSTPARPPASTPAPAPVQDVKTGQDDFAAGARQKFGVTLK